MLSERSFILHHGSNLESKVLTGYGFKHVIIPFIIGCSVYLFLRTDVTIAEKIIGWHLNPFVHVEKNTVLSLLAGTLPDFCWLYSLLFLQNMIWRGKKNVPSVILLSLYILPILSELLQGLKIIPGTGDWFDVTVYLLAIWLHRKSL